MKRLLLYLIFTCFPLLGLTQTIYNTNNQTICNVSSGVFKNSNGVRLGTYNNVVYDANGRSMGSVSSGRVTNSSGRTLYTYTSSAIMNSNGRTIYRISNNTIYTDSNVAILRYRNVDINAIIVYLLFFK